jgi:hypothetical protein
MDAKVRGLLESDIRMTHERACAAMERRLPDIDGELLERYFVVLSKLVEKLEDLEKNLGQVMNEMMAEAASAVLSEMRRPRS